jgi:hypothetical protein
VLECLGVGQCNRLHLPSSPARPIRVQSSPETASIVTGHGCSFNPNHSGSAGVSVTSVHRTEVRFGRADIGRLTSRKSPNKLTTLPADRSQLLCKPQYRCSASQERTSSCAVHPQARFKSSGLDSQSGAIHKQPVSVFARLIQSRPVANVHEPALNFNPSLTRRALQNSKPSAQMQEAPRSPDAHHISFLNVARSKR